MMFFWTHCGQDTETWTTEVGSAQTIKFYREFMTKSNLKIPHQDLRVDIFFEELQRPSDQDHTMPHQDLTSENTDWTCYLLTHLNLDSFFPLFCSNFLFISSLATLHCFILTAALGEKACIHLWKERTKGGTATLVSYLHVFRRNPSTKSIVRCKTYN
jgi:hypothetical protein